MIRTRRKTRVAVVDDDRDFLEAVRHMLAPAHEVECFSSGAYLPDDLAALEPDILLLDLHMPDPDGVEVCRRIRADPRLADLPVLFLTGSKADEDFLKTIRVGADAYLNKPIGVKELSRRIRQALKGAAPSAAGKRG